MTTYKLTATDGAAWNLTSNNKKIKLGRYLNHQVTVKGNIVEVAKSKSGDPKDAKRSEMSLTFPK